MKKFHVVRVRRTKAIVRFGLNVHLASAMGGDGVGITKEITRKKSDVYLRAPNSDDTKFFQKFFCLVSRVGDEQAAGKFHQKISTLSGRKSSDKVSLLRTIRGHLGLTPGIRRTSQI